MDSNAGQTEPDGAQLAQPSPRRTISRAPLYVLMAFFAVALTLVLFGAMQSAEKPNQHPSVLQPGTAESPRPVTVIMRDYLFEPNPLALVPGETVRITAIDAGLDAHELVLGDQSVQDAWATANAEATPPGPLTTPPPVSPPAGTGGLRVLVQSGQQVTVDWTVPGTGPLLMQCHLPGHLERGMSAGVVLQQVGPGASPGQ